MAILYRLETNESTLTERNGAYYGYHGLSDIALEEYLPNIHPTPNEDAGLRTPWLGMSYDLSQLYKFGFPSLQHYRNWFLSEIGREAIVDMGVIGVYEVPDEYFHKGQFQALAHGGYMRHIADLLTTTMLDEYREGVPYA